MLCAGERGHLPRHGEAADEAGLAALGRGHTRLLAGIQTPAPGQGRVVRTVPGAVTIILTIHGKKIEESAIKIIRHL